jgi:hypothetical protein
MKTRNISSSQFSNPTSPSLAVLAHALILVPLFCTPLRATVLDSFTGPKTGWTDTLNDGTIVQSGGEFTITTATPGGSLTYSRKTSSSFAVASGNSLEFRVNVDTVTPGAGNVKPLTILGWVPANGALLANGYSVSVGAADFVIQKGASVLYATNFTGAGVTLTNSNITIALRMTGSGNAVTVNARVYKRIGNGVIANYFTTVFEQTVVDSSGLLASGNAALGVKNQASGTGSAAAFSTLQVFNTATTVLDAFDNGTLDTNKWKVFKKLDSYGDSVTVGPTGLEAQATLIDATGGFAGVYSANTTYTITDGGQVEFQLDVVNNVALFNSYSALGYLPIPDPQYIYGLLMYHLAHDYNKHTIAVSGKGYNEWWGGRNDIQPPTAPPGCRYILTMTGEGTNCRIESRMEDLSVADVNDPARVVWQSEFVDTPALDPGLNENTAGNPAPYLNAPSGRFTIATFNAGIPYPNFADVIYSNAVVRQTAPPPTPPIVANLSPGYGSNFMVSSSVISFDVTDTANLPLSGMSIKLNGVTYAAGSPGVTITPGGSSKSQHFALANALANNVNYVGSVQSTNSQGLVASSPLVFDTFLASDYVVESEEYNFSLDGGATGGAYIANPVLIAEGNSDPNAYNAQVGFPEVDFHDNRGTSFGLPGLPDANHSFRYDWPYNAHSSDAARAKYVAAGGSGAGFWEQEIEDIYDGDWLNYTHTYPAGTYNVFLRQATWKLQNSLVTLERVSGATGPTQVNSVLGTFVATPTGIGLFVNVPLTDGPGNPMILRLSGAVDTFQIHNYVTGNADLDTGNLQQNYWVLVPVTDPGIGNLRPAVALVSPLANAKVTSAQTAVSAIIANRDTTVNIGTIGMKINGNTVTPTLRYATNNGAYVSYTLPAPLPAPGSTVTNTVYFQDSGSVWQTNTWTWTAAYTYLAAANSLPAGSLAITGFDARMVQSAAANLGSQNTVAAARSVLAGNYTVDLTSTNLASVVAWDVSLNFHNGAFTNFPGLCLPPANVNSFAIETFAYVHLTAGAHFFHVDSDDAVGIYTGTSLRDDSITLVENNGTTHLDFNLVAEADGLYPIHIIYEQGGGDAYLVLKSLDGGTTNVVNTSGAPAAYYPFVVKSATSVTGPYTADTAANAGNVPTTASVLCDGTGTALNQTLTGGTVTVPISGSAKFYRLDGPRRCNITSVKKTGSNLVINYQVQ